MAEKKDLSAALVPNYGTECIMYATGSGWAYGERTTADGGVTYTDAEGEVLLEPTDWVRCDDDSCTGAEVRKICGPVQLAGMSDLINALSPTGAGLAGKICADPSAVSSLGECLGIEPPVTYEWLETNPVDGDGIVVYTGTPSDGSEPQLITIAEPTIDSDTIQTGSTLVDGIVTTTFTDIDGNPLSDQTLDLSELISTSHPEILAGDGITAVFDAATNGWTISSSVVDTDTDIVNIITANPDGSVTSQLYDNVAGANVGPPTVIPAPSDTNVSANKLDWDAATGSFVSTVTEDGTDVVGALVVPSGANECGDSVIGIDANGELKSFPHDPDVEDRTVTVPTSVIITPINDTATFDANVYLEAPITCETVSNNTCGDVRLTLKFRLGTAHSATYSGISKSTLHRTRYSEDGGLTWANAITNKGMSYVNTNYVRPNGGQREDITHILEIDGGVLPAGATKEFCIQSQHYVVGADNSLASNHNIETRSSLIILVKDAA